MIVVEATVQVRPDKIEEFESLFRDRAAKARASETGLVMYEIARSPETPGTYKVFEAFADMDAAHIHHKFLEPYLAGIYACLAGDPILEQFETVV